MCGTDIERANDTHQWDRLILSQSTKQPFGFRHSGCSQGEDKLQSRGILCNSPREGAAALHQPSSAELLLTHTQAPEQDFSLPGARLLLMDVARCAWYSCGGMSCWERSALWPWNLHKTEEGPPGEKNIPGKGTYLEEKQTGSLWLFFLKLLVRHFGK